MSKESEIKVLEIELRKLRVGKKQMQDRASKDIKFLDQVIILSKQIEKIESEIESLRAS